MGVSINNISDYYTRLNLNSYGFTCNCNKAEDQKSAKKVDASGKVECQTNQTGICPECGNAYVSGRTTKTVVKDAWDERKDYFFTKYNDIVAKNYGLILDVKL